MKTVLNILILLFNLQIANAECSAGFIFYPQNSKIYKNSKIIIESYGWMKYHILLKELDDKYPIFLKSQNDKIRLEKEAFIKGQYGLSQAIFKPEKELRVGESYEVEVQNLNAKDEKKFNNVVRWKSGKAEKLVWVVKKKSDYEYPKITKGMKFSETSIIEYGCGDAIFSIFKFKSKDESELFVLTEVFEVESEKSLQYFLSSYKGELTVGHGMCSGAFRFEDGKSYKIRFKFYDINGNTDDKWTDWVKCENPFEHEEK